MVLWTFCVPKLDRPRSFAEFSASPNYRGRYRNAATGYVVGNVLESCAPLNEPDQSPQMLVGVSLLAMAVDQLAELLDEQPPSRAGSLLQGICGEGSDGIEQFVTGRAIDAANHPIAPRGLGFIQRLIRIVKPQGCVGMRRVKRCQTNAQADLQPWTLLVT